MRTAAVVYFLSLGLLVGGLVAGKGTIRGWWGFVAVLLVLTMGAVLAGGQL